MMNTFITGIVSGCVGMFLGAVIQTAQFNNEYSCTESSIVNWWLSVLSTGGKRNDV